MNKTYNYYARLILPIRQIARDLGYAIGVHGSLNRDIDLIAVPWTTDATIPKLLAFSIFRIVRENTGDAYWSWHPSRDQDFTLNGCPGIKPHGRLGWIINIDEDVYIDLSVMPRKLNE